ncbi:MAG: glutamine--tRNA ligase/YqeY domain fusion protein [Erysipelotrichaceae bacterium]|nr:glutamine--tRNA ligase/YqeY domain fusion protein [Erysipelotrichaceae bacterium]
MAEEIKVQTTEEENENRNFIYNFIKEDIAPGGQFEGMTVHTRFPPEPNGYLHIGHCKALCIDFGMAEKFGGICNLRMDDTNPAKEDTEYVDAIKDDIHWLGFDWGDRFYYGSDYFEKDYEYAVELIKKGLAYVCELTPEQFKEYRGDTTTPAKSPYRDRPIEENLRLFEMMKNGEVEEGKMTLRAKIDLASGNFNMRDPVIYRIRFINHHRQGKKWCIYPMYDFAHPIQDALEGITHSLCSLEYEDHRPLYNWMVENVSIPYHKPRQIEFARLNIDHTVMSKRKLRKLVEEGYVSGWDDPRMPTLCGLRRRGYTAASIRNFCDMIGVAKNSSVIEYSELERCLRDDLNATAERTMAVLHPLKLTVTNYPFDLIETFEVENNPMNPEQGTHTITFSRNLWIEEDDFLEVPIPKYKRLYPGNEVRLKGAYLVTCTGCRKDENGNVVEVFCEYDPESRGGNPADGRKVKGATIHWVDFNNCLDAEVRLYDNLFSDPSPDAADKDFLKAMNPDSLTILNGCKVEKSMAEIAKEYDKLENKSAVTAPTFQFMRVGFFCLDCKDSTPEHIVFNRTVSLKDSFKK